MRNLVLSFFFSLLALSSVSSYAAGPKVELESIEVDLDDKASLQRGARTFVNYCLSCHSASYMRYNRMAKDIGLTEEQVKASLMFTTDKIGDTMSIAMSPEDGKKWFGVAPPDLSVISRAKGTDWLYTYLRTFYLDDSKIMGTNNLVFKDVGMPHIMWLQQGYLAKDKESGELVPAKKPLPESMQGMKLEDFSPSSLEYKVLAASERKHMEPYYYNLMVKDLVNFLAYIGEPSKIERLALAKWVLIYLVIFFLVAYPMKKAFWEDVH